MTFSTSAGPVYLWSPKDGRIVGLRYTPEPVPSEPALVADVIELNLSTVASVYAEQFAMAMTAIQGMTQAETKARVRQMEELRLITSDVAKVLIESVIPLLP